MVFMPNITNINHAITYTNPPPAPGDNHKKGIERKTTVRLVPSLSGASDSFRVTWFECQSEFVRAQNSRANKNVCFLT